MTWDPIVWEQRYGLLFRCWLSRAYHQKRERFYDQCDNLAKAVSVVGGSATVAQLLNHDAMVVTAALITVTATGSLLFGFARKARLHADLARSFAMLEARIVGSGVFDAAQMDALQAELVAMEVSEPRALGALLRICHNEIVCAEGHRELVQRVGPWQRALAHFYDFDLYSRQPS
ncbi:MULTISPECIES: hypothetical protein [unclassified Cupriavidus]|uniref:hypothetical protein n=1 Tax=Cupriavidus sp. H19C3 TaxID=3241603 RepID=UPI003BF7B697